MDAKELFKKMAGRWSGPCQTWFQPGKLADESNVDGEFEIVMENFLRHSYHGTINGKPRKGEELIGHDEIVDKFRVSWIDSFHMSKAIMFSEGHAIENGFSVMGRYEVGKDQPAWGWRTTYELENENTLIITAYNVTPDGQEAKAVQTKYTRK